MDDETRRKMNEQLSHDGVQYASELGGMGIGAVKEILFPFGEPEWIADVDPDAFKPRGE